MRPVLGQDATTVRIGFHLPADGMSRPFQAQIQTADATEQTADRHQSPLLTTVHGVRGGRTTGHSPAIWR